MKIKDKTMLITGASSGIGAATSRAAALEGATVLLLARSAEKLERLATEIRSSGGQAQAFPIDLTQAQPVHDLAERIKAEYGVPDVIFNNAGAGRWLYTDETSMAEAAAMMAAPYLAAFYVTGAFLPDMLQRNSGAIVNITSAAAYIAWPGATAYLAARWAMRGFTKGLQADLRDTNLLVTLAVFAKVKSEYWQNNPGSEEKVPGVQALISTLSCEQVAEAILAGIRKDRPLVMAPLMLRFMLGLNHLFPSVTGWLLYTTSQRRSPAIKASP